KVSVEMKKALVIPLLHSVVLCARAQNQKKPRNKGERTPQHELVYDNVNYIPAIKAVQFHPIGQENALPLINLHSDDQLTLAFDDLRGDVRNYYFSMEHCDADWKPSRLSPLEYAEGLNEERVVDYAPSVNTLQAYTHYHVDFPTRNSEAKLARDYVLERHEDADERLLMLSRRCHVVAPVMMVSPQLVPSASEAKRRSNEKINIQVNTGGLTVNNP